MSLLSLKQHMESHQVSNSTRTSIKKAKYGEDKFKHERQTVEDDLWSRDGRHDVSAAVLEAEESGRMAKDVPVLGVNVEAFKIHMDLLIKEDKTVKGDSAMERWIPAEERRSFHKRIKNLRSMSL